jgi:hypothetical protein
MEVEELTTDAVKRCKGAEPFDLTPLRNWASRALEVQVIKHARRISKTKGQLQLRRDGVNK